MWYYCQPSVLLTAFFLGASCCCVLGQSGEIRSCHEGLKISVDYDYVFPPYGGADGVRVMYGINKPAVVSSAWVEIWDGGLRLLHQEVLVRPKGDFKWMHLNDVPHTPSDLTLAIFDPELPLFGDDPAQPSKGGTDYRSAYWAGSSPDEQLPFRLSDSLSYRMEEGNQRGDLQLDGLFVGAPKEILLEEQSSDTHWLARQYLLPRVFDRNHLQLTIPEHFLEKPGILGLSEKVGDPEFELGSEVKPPQQTIYIASKDSPTLSQATPSEVSASDAGEGSFTMPIHLHGDGFTPASSVVQALYDRDPRNFGQTKFISASELEYDLYKGDVIRSAGQAIRLWVVNGDWLHVSEPLEIRITSSSQFPPDPLTAQASRITSISPDPIKLIDPAGPAFLRVVVQGDNFRRGEAVVAIVLLDDDEKQVRLRTQFTSSTELRAWLPRSAWSEHRLKYAFGVKTQAGSCSIRVAEDDDN